MKRKGFTLVELLCVLVIMSIVALIAVPNISGYIDRTKHRTCTAEINNLAQEISTSSVSKRHYRGPDDCPEYYFNKSLKSFLDLTIGIEDGSTVFKYDKSNHEYALGAVLCPNGGMLTVSWSVTEKSSESATVEMTISCGCGNENENTTEFDIFYKEKTTQEEIVEPDEASVRVSGAVISGIEPYRELLAFIGDMLIEFRASTRENPFTLNSSFIFNGIEYTAPVSASWNWLPDGKYSGGSTFSIAFFVEYLKQEASKNPTYSQIINDERFADFDPTDYKNEFSFMVNFIIPQIMNSDSAKQTLTVDGVSYTVTPRMNALNSSSLNEDNYLYIVTPNPNSNDYGLKIDMYYNKENKCWYKFVGDDTAKTLTLGSVSGSSGENWYQRLLTYQKLYPDRFELVG